MVAIMVVLGISILVSGWWGRVEFPIGLGLASAGYFGFMTDTQFNTMPLMLMGCGLAYFRKQAFDAEMRNAFLKGMRELNKQEVRSGALQNETDGQGGYPDK